MAEQERSCNADREDKSWPCKHCGVSDVWYTKDVTFDGAYDTYDYHCHACGKRWHVVDETD